MTGIPTFQNFTSGHNSGKQPTFVTASVIWMNFKRIFTLMGGGGLLCIYLELTQDTKDMNILGFS